MSLETATYINGLVATNPLGSDPISSGDDHIRLIKSTVLATFPNLTGAVTKTQTQLNNALDKTGDTMSGLLVLSGDPSANLGAATKQYVDGAVTSLASLTATAIQALYPVGSVYTNASNSTNPGSLLGFGTWASLGAGRVLIGAGSNGGQSFTAGSTGGSYAPSMPSHTHTATDSGHTHYIANNGTRNTTGGTYAGWKGQGGVDNDLASNDQSTAPTIGTTSVTAATITVAATSSGDTTTGNLPPYLTVYMWQRTA